MKEIILGTAGHIDHGKTSLIKALTGINTDRLKEEQVRGITIELGFASTILKNGQKIGIVDVPGHEKFIKNMLAGASGIDILAMVVTADEGIMPQTKEHLQIASLLGIKKGLIVITKTDLVEQEWLNLVCEEIKDFFKNSFLENAPIVFFSSKTKKGKEDFFLKLTNIAEEIPKKSKDGIFRLPIDRVFTMKGFGTVVTGTIISGSVKKGENLVISGDKQKIKVRGIQVHNVQKEEAFSGMRCAINLQNIEKEKINRGSVLSKPLILKKSKLIDTQFQYLNSNKKPLKNYSKLRFHIGTKESNAKIIFYNQKEITPGTTVFAQFVFDESFSSIRDDKFVIRTYSPTNTIGGGRILNPLAKKHKNKETIEEDFEMLANSQNNKIINALIKSKGLTPLTFNSLKIMSNLTNKKLENALIYLKSKNLILEIDKELYVYMENFNQLIEKAYDILCEYHKTNPLKNGMPKEEIKSKLPKFIELKFFNKIISFLQKKRGIVVDKNLLKTKNHKVKFKKADENLKKEILDIYNKEKFQPPSLKFLCEKLSVDKKTIKKVLSVCITNNEVIKINEELFFTIKAINEIKMRLVDFLKKNAEISPKEFKEIIKISRKYCIPLLEFFDKKNITIRVENIRRLR